jgi:hypothetical protein
MNVAYAGDFWPRPSWRQRQQTMVFADSVSEPVTVAPPVVSPPTTASLPLWLEPTLSRMRELSALGRDWDRRGSAAVRQDALQFAYSVLMEVMAPTTPAPSIVPLGHGGVQLLWKSPSAEIEVEVVLPNNIIIYHLDRTNGAEDEQAATTEFSALARLLRSAFAR